MFGQLPRAPGNIATTANTATNKYLKHSIYTDLIMNLFLKLTKKLPAFTHWFILYINVQRVLNVISLFSSSRLLMRRRWMINSVFFYYDDEMIYKRGREKRKE